MQTMMNEVLNSKLTHNLMTLMVYIQLYFFTFKMSALMGTVMSDKDAMFGLCCLMTPGLSKDIRCHVHV